MWLTVVRVLHLILSLILIAVVLLQSGKAQGLSGAIAGGSETFFGKNKGKTAEAKLVLFTKISGAIFFVLALVASLLVLFGA